MYPNSNQKEGSLMIRLRALLSICTLGFLVAGTACGSSESDFQNYPSDSSSNMDGSQGDIPNGQIGALSFVKPVGDDDKPCTDTCTLYLSYNSTQKLEVLYVGADGPIPNATVRYEIIQGQETTVQLTAKTATSNNTGAAVTQVKGFNTVGEVRIAVSVDGAPSVTPIYFDVAVTPKGTMPLSILLVYQGSRNLEGTDVLLFRQTAEKPYNCADLDVTNLPTAELGQYPIKPLPYSVNFPVFPDLENDSPQNYTMVAVGHEVDGPPLAWACEDGTENPSKVKVAYGASNQLTLVLKDIPPKLQGLYEFENYFDLITMVPEEAQGIINGILELFENPSGGLLLLTCELGETQLQDLCSQIFQDPANPCLEPVGTCLEGWVPLVMDIIDQIVFILIEETLAEDIFDVGQDVRDLLKDLNFESTVEILAEPDPSGLLTEADTKEIWHTLNYRWTLGKNCPTPDDGTCGWESYSLYALPDLNPDLLTGHFTATVNEFETIDIDPHSVNLKYGILLNFLLEKVVIPAVMSDPNVDTWEDFLGTLLGGQGCAVQGICCQNLGAQVEPVWQSTAESLCTTITTLAGTAIRGQLMGLDADSGESFVIGTKEPCHLFDVNQDQWIDQFGTEGTMCIWDASIDFNGDVVHMDADFLGKRVD